MFAGKHDKTMCTCTYAIVESVMDSYPLGAIDLACGNHQAKRSFCGAGHEVLWKPGKWLCEYIMVEMILKWHGVPHLNTIIHDIPNLWDANRMAT